MTRERARELLPIMKAYSEGKDLQCKHKTHSPDIPWENALYPTFSSDLIYRVKPEPKYIPFTFEDRDMFKDRWIYSKEYGNLTKIIHIEDDSVRSVTIGTGDAFSYSELLNLYTFEDGTPCGKLVTV